MRGGLERVGRVTVNTTFSFFHLICLHDFINLEKGGEGRVPSATRYTSSSQSCLLVEIFSC